MSVLFGADLHLGHRNIAKYRDRFDTAESHHEFFYDLLNEHITKRSVVYLLGDICFTVEDVARLSGTNRLRPH